MEPRQSLPNDRGRLRAKLTEALARLYEFAGIIAAPTLIPPPRLVTAFSLLELRLLASLEELDRADANTPLESLDHCDDALGRFANELSLFTGQLHQGQKSALN
jgi:hypothetical protein